VDGTDPPARRRVVRGQGEVTEWPRGLTGYRPSGPEDATPSPEEDRVANRIALAARLLGVLGAGGADVTAASAELARAAEALRRGDRESARRRTEAVLADLARRPAAATRREP
jgi:hypothetical protein